MEEKSGLWTVWELDWKFVGKHKEGRQAGRHFIAFDFFSPDNYNHQAKAQAAQINVCPIQFWEHCAHIHRSSFFENLK